MSSDLKQQVLELYNIDKKQMIEKLLKYNNDIVIRNNTNSNSNSNSNKINKIYLDYNINNLQKAEKQDLLTLYVNKKTGITDEIINKILYNNNYNKTYLIINFLKILTKSTIKNESSRIINMESDNFIKYYEEKIKWGDNIENKLYLSEDKRNEYNLFRENYKFYLEKLYINNIKIIIVSTLNSKLVEKIFEINGIDKYIEKYITCDMFSITNKKRRESIKDLLYYANDYICKNNLLSN